MAEFDVQQQYLQLERNLTEARELARANPGDDYIKLQYTAAQEDMVRYRRFWRSIDQKINEDDPDFGRVHGRGRRNGERIKTEE